MLVTESRPRNLKWFHAGPLLFGDWGTSRLYVLGLAFYYTGHASVLYLSVLSVIMIAVAWAYTVVCRNFPDGGGVYAAARRLNPHLSVFAATLLLCDYIVTAALSAVEGFHYLGAPHEMVVPLCVSTIILIGIINWFGAKSAGRFALIVAIAALGMSLLIAICCVPYLGKGLASITTHVDGASEPLQRWESLVRIVLALSGVEAVANMTGLMRQPVARTAKRTIWPVLIEVVALNLIFGIALNAMPLAEATTTPAYIAHEVRENLPSGSVPAEVKEFRDTAVRVLATETSSNLLGTSVGRAFGAVSGVVFGLLLLSAVNTAIMAMVSVMYSLSQDRELPRAFKRLNYSGVPIVGLAIACAMPMAVLLIEADVKVLSELYAIGVVGAIAVNLLCCAYNRELVMKRWERNTLWIIGSFMTLVEITIVIAKPNATIFAGTIVGTVLVARFAFRLLKPIPIEPPAEPTHGWLAQVKRTPPKLDPNKPRIMLAARGHSQQAYAVDLARRRGAILFAMFVRTVRVLDLQPGQVPRIEDDREAQEALGSAAVLAEQASVPFVPIYVTSTEIAEEILDYTATFGCDTLIMGKSRRSLFARTVAGDVVARIAAVLPKEIDLILRAGEQSSPPPPPSQPPGTTEGDSGPGAGRRADDRSPDDSDLAGPT